MDIQEIKAIVNRALADSRLTQAEMVQIVAAMGAGGVFINGREWDDS